MIKKLLGFALATLSVIAVAAPPAIPPPAPLSLPVSTANGGTGASTVAGAKTNLGVPSIATNAQTISPATIPAWGDSITYGQQDLTLPVTPWPAYFSTLTGVPTNNYGISGQLSTQISMRMGAVPTVVTLSGNAIASGTAATTTITALGQSSGTQTTLAGETSTQSPDYRFLSAVGDIYTRYDYGNLCGVHGYIKRSATGGPPSTTEIYQWVSDNAGASSCSPSGTGSTYSQFVPDNVVGSQCSIVEMGRNNFAVLNGGTPQPQLDWAAAFAQDTANSNTCRVYMTILSGDYTTEYNGQSNKTTLQADNTYLTTNGPSTRVFDILAYLISQANSSNIVDQYNVSQGVVPYSLRAVVANDTLNGAITTATCSTTPIVLTGTAPLTAQTVALDSGANLEYVYITATSGQSITGCIRGYGTGGVAVTHSSGVAAVLTDPLHPSSAADRLIAAKLQSSYLSSLVPAVNTSSAVTPSAVAAYFNQPIVQIGLNSASNNGSNSEIYLNGRTFLSYDAILPINNSLDSYNSSGAIMGLIKGTNNNVYIGGTNVVATCVGNGGTNGNCPVEVNNGGFLQDFFGVQDSAYVAPQTITTGGTVTIPSYKDWAFLTASGTIPTQAFILPNCNVANDGVLVGFSSTQQITSILSVTATTGTVNSFPASLAAGGAAYFRCVMGVYYLEFANLVTPPTYKATSASIGGSALVAGACTTPTTVTVTGAATGGTQTATLSPNTYPGAGFFWEDYISAANTVTVEVCAAIAGTPTASTYNVTVQ